MGKRRSRSPAGGAGAGLADRLPGRRKNVARPQLDVRCSLEQFQEKCVRFSREKRKARFPLGIAKKQRDRAVRRFRETVKRSRLGWQTIAFRTMRCGSGGPMRPPCAAAT